MAPISRKPAQLLPPTNKSPQARWTEKKLNTVIRHAIRTLNAKLRTERKATKDFRFNLSKQIFRRGSIPECIQAEADCVWRAVAAWGDWRCGYQSLVKIDKLNEVEWVEDVVEEQVVRDAAKEFDEFVPKAQSEVQGILMKVRHQRLAKYVEYRVCNLLCLHHGRVVGLLREYDEGNARVRRGDDEDDDEVVEGEGSEHAVKKEEVGNSDEERIEGEIKREDVKDTIKKEDDEDTEMRESAGSEARFAGSEITELIRLEKLYKTSHMQLFDLWQAGNWEGAGALVKATESR